MKIRFNETLHFEGEWSLGSTRPGARKRRAKCVSTVSRSRFSTSVAASGSSQPKRWSLEHEPSFGHPRSDPGPSCQFLFVSLHVWADDKCQLAWFSPYVGSSAGPDSASQPATRACSRDPPPPLVIGASECVCRGRKCLIRSQCV